MIFFGILVIVTLTGIIYSLAYNKLITEETHVIPGKSTPEKTGR